MELVNEIVNNQFALYIPVALVLVGAILVFAFGFKSAEQPPFDKLSSIDSDERKTLGKKKKLKEKKSSANGNIVNVNESKVEKSPSKDSRRKEQADNARKTENNKLAKSTTDRKKNDKLVEEKLKRSTKAKLTEKPADFDDGNWETVPVKGEKKKKQDSPAKKDKDKKTKKTEKSVEVDKLVKEIVNKELQENDSAKKSPLPASKEVEEKVTKAKLEVTEIKIEPVELKKEKPEKKAKKIDPEIIENVKEEVVENTVTSTPEKQHPVPAKSEQAPVKPPEIPSKETVGNVAFDELGDVWTEAKQLKKSKKKSRRDN